MISYRYFSAFTRTVGNRGRPRIHELARLFLAGSALLACSDSNPLDPTGEVQPPQRISAEPTGPTSIRLSWANSEGSARSFVVERRAALNGEFETLTEQTASQDSLQTLLDSGLDPETFYGYRIRTVGALGARSAPSVVAGARTASLPRIEVQSVTNAPNPESADLDGFVARIEGPVSATVVLGPNDVKRSDALPAGEYTVRLEGVRESCTVQEPATVSVTLTDEGVNTVQAVSFLVACRDPSRGEVVVEVETIGEVPVGEQYQIALTGVVSDTVQGGSVDFVRDVNAAQLVASRFLNLIPGSYQAQLRSFPDEVCEAVGPVTTDEFPVAALSSDTVRFTLRCSTDEVQPEDAPFVWLNLWEEDTVPEGETAVLRVQFDATAVDAARTQSVQALLRWDANVIQLDSAAGIGSWGQFFTVGDIANGQADFSALSLEGEPGLTDVGRFFFTVVGSEGETVTVRAPRDPVRLLAGQVPEIPIPLDSIRVVGDTLTVGTPTNGGGGGEGSTPLTAEAGGPYSGATGSPIALNGSASSGPVSRFIWSFGDGSPPDSSGARVSHTYATAGTFDAVLTVRDAEGGVDADTARVTVIEPSQGEGNFFGRWVDATGAPITRADPGDEVRLQLCSPLADLNAFQATIGNFATLVTLLDSREFDSARGTGVHPDCVASFDPLDAFFTTQAVSRDGFEGVNAQVVSTVAPDTALGRVGIFEFDLRLEAEGAFTPTLEEVNASVIAPVSEGGFRQIDIIPDLTPLVIGNVDDGGGGGSGGGGTGGGGGGDPAPEPSAWRNRWSADSAGVGQAVTLSVTTAPTVPVHWILGDVSWDPTVLQYDSGLVAARFTDLRALTLEGDGRVDVNVRAPTSSPVPAGEESSVATLFFTVVNTGTSRTTTENVILWQPPLSSVPLAGLAIVEDTLRSGSGLPNARPTAEANGPYTGRSGAPTTFSAAGSTDPDGTIVRFDWDFGDGSTGTGATPQHTYASEGSYTVRLTVTDDDGGIATDETPVTIVTTAAPVARANGPYTAQAGMPLSLSASGSFDPDGSVRRFEWNLGDGNSASGPAPLHTYQSAGTFTVILTVFDDLGVPGSDTTTVTVVEPEFFSMRADWSDVPLSAPASGPALAISGPPADAGPGDRVRLSLRTRPGAPLLLARTVLSWDSTIVRYDSAQAGPDWSGAFSATRTSVGAAEILGTRTTASLPTEELLLADLFFTVVGLDGGSTNVLFDEIELRDGQGAAIDLSGLLEIVSQLDITEAGGLPPTADAGGPYQSEPGAVLMLDGSGSQPGSTDGAIVRYDWLFGDGVQALDAGPAPSHTYQNPGTFGVTLTVTDDNGVTATDRTIVEVPLRAPTGELRGAWLDAAGNPIVTARVGDRVRFQLCTTFEEANAFQASVSGFNAVTPTADQALGDFVSAAELNSAGADVHPWCVGQTDLLNDFFSFGATENPPGSGVIEFVTVNVVRIDGNGPSGPQGIATFEFDLTRAGTLQLGFFGDTSIAVNDVAQTFTMDVLPLTVLAP